MKKKNTKIIITAAIAAIGSWWLFNSLNEKNNTLEFRAIPERSEILKAMQNLAEGSQDYQKYSQTLQSLCESNPVNEQIIIDRLTLAQIYDSENITISEGQARANGEFTLKPYTIFGRDISAQELDFLLNMAQEMSLATPKINISKGQNIMAQITIYGLEYNKAQ